VNPVGSKFCNACGKKLGEPSESKEAKPVIDGERKQVTVLFSDLSGYTAMSERLDPEEVKEIMSRVFGEIAQVVTKYEGFLEKFIGDAVVAFFGIPKTHEDDPIRAIQAAKEIHCKIEAMSSQFERRIGKHLGMHTGINTGLVVTGEVDLERGIHGVVGDTINLASRLSELAKAGEIYIGQDTYRRAKGYFNFERLEPCRVKGKDEPLSVFRVLESKEKTEHIGGGGIQLIRSPLVGRNVEFMAIKGCLNRLLDGQGGILSIIGEAGMGKSRLMAEIRNSLAKMKDGVSIQWWEGHTLSFGHAISYWPFREILRQYAGITEDDSETDAWEKLERRITAIFSAETAEILPYIASLITLEVKGEYAEKVKYLDGEAMGRQVFLASWRFFERLAQNTPVMLVFEDLHWADESSTLLLEHLLPLVKRVPLLFCGVSRLDPKTPAARLRETAVKDYERRYTEIRLAPLSPTETTQLMHNLLKIENLSLHISEKIVNKSEGNPFFLEEIIRSLMDARVVVLNPVTGSWRATAEIETIIIPDTIKGVIMARLDRLDADLKQVLRMASVIGRSFLYRILRAVAEADRELDQHLLELQGLELIREKQLIPEVEYIFKHALVQEATYESLLLKKRRELHERVGQAIEVLFTDRLEEFYSLLAYHYARAEAWEKAHGYLLKTGDQAGRVAADTEALAHYRQALAAYTRAFGDKWEPFQRAALERKMGEAFFRRGEHEQAMEYLQRALAYLSKPLPTSPWGVRLAILREIAQQISHRLLPRLFLKSMGGSVNPVVEEEIRLYEFIGWIDAFGNNKRFLLIALRGLNVSERSGFLYGVAAAYMALGTMCDL
jgi:class 3 adenylate cyclase